MTGGAPTGAHNVVRLPDADPLITLACADALDLLFKPGWTVQLADVVLHEVTRHATPTSQAIDSGARQQRVPVLPTRVFRHHTRAASDAAPAPKKANLGELAIQEAMTGFALAVPPTAGVFLFEDHKLARASSLLPESCRKVTTRAFLLFLERQGPVASAADVQARALHAGRAFSQLRFPRLGRGRAPPRRAGDWHGSASCRALIRRRVIVGPRLCRGVVQRSGTDDDEEARSDRPKDRRRFVSALECSATSVRHADARRTFRAVPSAHGSPRGAYRKRQGARSKTLCFRLPAPMGFGGERSNPHKR